MGEARVSYDLLRVRAGVKGWRGPDGFWESPGPASTLSDPGRRCWIKFPFQGVHSPPPFKVKLEQSWGNGAGVNNQETRLFTQLSRGALRER